MATIVNNPAPSNDSNGWGFFLGVILLIFFLLLVWRWGLPLMRGTQINIPSKIDVNVNQQQPAPQTQQPAQQQPAQQQPAQTNPAY